MTNIIKKATLLKITERINEINSFIQEGSFKKNGSYIILGFTEMQDDIILVSEHGHVFEIPYDEDVFAID